MKLSEFSLINRLSLIQFRVKGTRFTGDRPKTGSCIPFSQNCLMRTGLFIFFTDFAFWKEWNVYQRITSFIPPPRRKSARKKTTYLEWKKKDSDYRCGKFKLFTYIKTNIIKMSNKL